ncbi:MutS-related protein [Clostridium thermarum]|uniref:MutS-related protein n=1 Tax=Clostridium thermarum TaxID=1716543 RepID=UPI00111EF0D2|nr:MutS family DNA mismatch repair protein [Clostridium thermarum]
MMKIEKNYDLLMKLFLAAAGVAAYFSYTLGKNTDNRYYFGFIIVLIFIIISYFFKGKRDREIMLQYIMENWGKPHNKKRNLDIARRYFDRLSENCTGKYIDDQTWEDLNMNDIYIMLDRNLTTAGEQVLYDILRNPLYEEAPLLKRNSLIKLLQEDRELREKLQVILHKAGRLKDNDLLAILWGEMDVKTYMRVVTNLAAVMPMVLPILLYFISPYAAIISFILCFGINVYIHMNHGVKNDVSINSIRYLSDLVRAAGAASKLENETLGTYTGELKQIFSKVASIAKKSTNIGITEGLDVLMDYFKIIYLIEERSYYRVIDDIIKNREALQKMYRLIGELDSLISIASYRVEIDTFAEPKFVQGRRLLKAEGLVHPLLENPVTNNINIEEGGVIITGSNMSGKSTYLRALGLSALMAQTIYMVTADKYEACFYNIMTSISPNDSILQGKSYYLGEAEAVLRIINSCSDETPVLCIVDEIFRGTNPVERISASAEILKYIIKHNATAIVATHDLELTELLAENFENYYFTENVDSEEGLQFDYKIRKGVSNTRNAIRLLEYLGYPDVIVQAAEKQITG